MNQSTSSLATFDFLELLLMLGSGRRTGVLRVYRDHEFEAWMHGGTVTHLQFGQLEGVAALVELMNDPRGRFNFEEGQVHPNPRLNLSMEVVAMEALRDLPLPELPFPGPARIVSPERVRRMNWTLRQEDVLREIEAGMPLSELAERPEAQQLVARLGRLGLLTARKPRMARLTVGVTREVRGVAVIDETILRRWREDLGRHIAYVALRDHNNEIRTFRITSSVSAGTQLLVSPEMLLRTQLHVGDAVLVQPAI